MVRLAIVTHDVIRGDGQARVNYELARHALRRGISVWLIADRVDPELLELGATWVPVHPQCRRLHLSKVVEFALRANRAIDRLAGQIDLIHANGFVSTRPHHVNTSHLVHGAWLRSSMHTSRLRRDPYGFYHLVYSALNARWERRAYDRAKVTVAVSERVRQELVGIGVLAKNVRVVMNGVDLEEFHPGHESRQSLGLPLGVPLAVFVGTLRTPIKNLDTLLYALLDVTDLHLAVVGATEGSPYPELAIRLGLSDRVSFLGYRRDIPKLLRAAELLVLPSRYDSFALVVLEAMASGVPVLLSSMVGAAQLVTPECGVVVQDPNDTRAVASALRSLLADPERRARMGSAARAIAEQHSWAHMGEAYYQVYQSVAH